jgi:hypothetical protein
MTYIVGVSQAGTNAIISDTHVTWQCGRTITNSSNTGLKIGLLFHGCIYGISGTSEEARKFIIGCKQFLTGRYTPNQFWERFISYTEKYHFNKDQGSSFELLLSTRNLGAPQFYVLYSSTGNIVPQKGLVTLGSGKCLLDSYLQHLVEQNVNIINNMISSENKLSSFTFPYLYCMWLNELAQGFDLPVLEKYHVGGVFHFLWQDYEQEHAQHPAVYVMSAADQNKKEIHSWIYRVSYSQGALVIDNPVSNSREIIMDTAARPNFKFLPWEDLKATINSEIDAQPFYYFCGFCFSDPKYQGGYGISITTEGKYAVGRNGVISPKFRAFLTDVFSNKQSLLPTDINSINT